MSDEGLQVRSVKDNMDPFWKRALNSVMDKQIQKVLENNQKAQLGQSVSQALKDPKKK